MVAPVLPSRGAVPAVAVLEVADPALASRAPLDQGAEVAGVLGGLAGWRCGGLARDGHDLGAQLAQAAFDGWLAIAAVGGNRAGGLASPPLPAPRGRLAPWSPAG